MPEPTPSDLTVMVIDDNDAALAATREVLAHAGYRVIISHRNAGVVGEILRSKPDVVLLDTDTAGLSNDTLSGILMRASPSARSKILLHSASPESLLKLTALRHGVHGYIRKTDRASDLLQQLADQLGLRTSSMRMRAAQPIAAQSPSAFQSVWPSDPGVTDSAIPPRKTSGTVRIPIVRALFVDDDVEMLRSYERAMRGREIMCGVAESGAAAWDVLCSPRPIDVVVADIMLPDISGIELYRRAIRRDPAWEQRFVFVTGATRVEYIADFLKTVPHAFTKPLDMTPLRQAIREVASVSAQRLRSRER